MSLSVRNLDFSATVDFQLPGSTFGLKWASRHCNDCADVHMLTASVDRFYSTGSSDFDNSIV